MKIPSARALAKLTPAEIGELIEFAEGMKR